MVKEFRLFAMRLFFFCASLFILFFLLLRMRTRKLFRVRDCHIRMLACVIAKGVGFTGKA